MIRSAVRQTVAVRNQGAQLQDATFRCVKREILLKQNSQLHISSISNLRKPIGVYRYVRSVCLLCKLG
ncbi:hypothetical protein T03_142, partial [Trichinella britovi]